MHGENGTNISLAEAVTILHPQITERALREIIRALQWQPAGHRRNGRAGRPQALYNAAEIMRLHGALTPWL